MTAMRSQKVCTIIKVFTWNYRPLFLNVQKYSFFVANALLSHGDAHPQSHSPACLGKFDLVGINEMFLLDRVASNNHVSILFITMC